MLLLSLNRLMMALRENNIDKNTIYTLIVYKMHTHFNLGFFSKEIFMLAITDYSESEGTHKDH